MSAGQNEIALYGLVNPDRLDLAEYLPDGEYRIESAATVGGNLGEPFTLAAIALVSVTAVRGLVAFLAARNVDRQEAVIDHDIEVRRPDGTVERHHLHVTKQGGAFEPELAEKLGSFTGLPWQELLP